MAGFELITIAADSYPETIGALDASQTALDFAELIAAGGDVRDEPVHHVLRTKADLEKLMDSWSAPDSPRSSIIYLVGHGEWDGERHTFLVPEVADEHFSKLATRSLADYLRVEWLRRKRDPSSWALSSSTVARAAGALATSRSISRPTREANRGVSVYGRSTATAPPTSADSSRASLMPSNAGSQKMTTPSV